MKFISRYSRRTNALTWSRRHWLKLASHGSGREPAGRSKATLKRRTLTGLYPMEKDKPVPGGTGDAIGISGNRM